MTYPSFANIVVGKRTKLFEALYIRNPSDRTRINFVRPNNEALVEI
jgi:hypothetical protein